MCILHSANAEKNERAFAEVLGSHREKNGDAFIGFVFPASPPFKEAEFSENADFSYATFNANADFSDATFSQDAQFVRAKFSGHAAFARTKFNGNTRFDIAKFCGRAIFTQAKFSWDAKARGDGHSSRCVDFSGAEFTGNARFSNTKFGVTAWFRDTKFGGRAQFLDAQFKEAKFFFAKFRGDADFAAAAFAGNAYFERAEFSGHTSFDGTMFTRNVDFKDAKFFGRTLFIPRKKDEKLTPIFPGADSGAECNFSDVIIEPPGVISFRDVDLTTCRFLGTDLRKAEFVGVTWPKIIFKWWPEGWSRFGVHDENEVRRNKETQKYPHIEELYRRLKQNYEDRKDYERAGDFHYGEKEMRRQAETTTRLWFLRTPYWLLTLYWLVSGYGERYVRPLIWMGGALLFYSICYLLGELLRFQDTTVLLDRTWTSFLETCLYSLQVMTLLKPTYFVPVGLWGRLIYTLQSISGPVLIGLFALAVRQRLKR